MSTENDWVIFLCLSVGVVYLYAMFGRSIMYNIEKAERKRQLEELRRKEEEAHQLPKAFARFKE